MASNPFNALLNPADIAASGQRAFDDGRKRAREAHRERALAAFVSNPENPDAAREVLRFDPALGIRLRNYQHNERERAQESAFNAALGDYVGRNSMLPPLAAPSPQGGAPLPDRTQGAAGGSGGDLSLLGQPNGAQDEAFLRMMRINPIKAMEIESDLRDNFMSRLNGERDLYGWAISRFGGISDPGEYQKARGELANRLEAFGPSGQGILSQVPEQFPGPQGLQALRLRALDAKDQIDAFSKQANIDADNERADRDLDDRITDRRERRGSLIDYRNQRIDIGRANAARAGAKTGSKKGGGKTSGRPRATNPQTGQTVEWNGKSWEPIQ